VTAPAPPTPPQLIVATNAPPGFHLLAKPTGATCNLDCTYCFFLSKEMLYPGSRFRMADELLETYIRQLLEAHRTPEVMVAWQGGEPTLMGLDFFRRSVELVEQYRRSGQVVQHTYHLNAEEEPECEDYPKDPEFKKKFGPRACCTAGRTRTARRRSKIPAR